MAAGTALGLLLYLPACYPGDPTNVQQLDVVITIRDTSVVFNAANSYAMPDTVIHIEVDSAAGIIELSRDFDDLILATVRQNMADLGYTLEADPEDNGADLVMLVGAIGTETTTWYASYPWWGYWGYWPGWGYWPPYGAGWGWYYPPYVGSVTYEQGTVIMTLIDPNEPVQENLAMVWEGALRGLLSTAGTPTEQRITQGINRAFDQSPYLQKN
jgi:hypothetical protein